MKNDDNGTIMREMVRAVLISEDGDYGNIGAGGYYGSNYGYGGYGYGVGGWGGQSVLSVFGTPFLDVAKTAIGSGKEVAKQAKGLVRTGLEASLSLVLPFVSGEYSKIAKETHEEVLKVKKEYEPVYKKNLDAFFNTDLVTLAFFLNPAAVVTGAAFDRFLYTAPDAALSVLGWFVPASGAKMWEKLSKATDPERLQRVLKTAAGRDNKTKLIVWDDRNRRKLYANVRRAMGIESDPSEKNEGLQAIAVIIKESEGVDGYTYQDVVKGIMRDPAIVNRLGSSEQAKSLRTIALGIINRRLDRVYDFVKKYTSAPTPEALGIKDDIDSGDFAKVKSEIKERIAKSLSAEVSALLEQGVDPKATGVKKLYDETIAAIGSLPVNIGGKVGTVGRHGKENTGNDSGEATGRAQGAEGTR